MRMSRVTWRACTVGAVLLAGSGWHADAGPVMTQFTVTGAVTTPATYASSTLSGLPATTESVTYQTGSGTQMGTFTGPTLWSLLNTIGLITPPPPVKNGVLLQYVVATGSDGYSALFSLGELNPNFGGRYVSNLDNLRVGNAQGQTSMGGGETSQFSLSGG